MRRPVLLTIALTLIAACGSESPAGPSAPPDVSGTWLWSEYTLIEATAGAADAFGIHAEGSVTHLDCHSWGNLSLNQTGSRFEGTATQKSWCTTPGGQAFDPAPLFPTSWQLSGEIDGTDMQFTVDTGGFPCHYEGVVQRAGGNIIELSAGGHCEVPPEMGTDRIVGWTAVQR